MSAEGRQQSDGFSQGGKESATSANRGFLSCHRDLELDRALPLCVGLFRCMVVPGLRAPATLVQLSAAGADVSGQHHV